MKLIVKEECVARMENKNYQPGYERLKQMVCWQDKIEGALFSKSNRVLYKGNNFIVEGVNDTDDGIEYLLEGLDVLVWEPELNNVP